MRRAGDAAAAVLLLAVCCAPTRAQTVDLRGGGAFDTVSIAGFLVPIDDIEEMEAAGILEFDPEAGRFAFADRITSEARLKAELGALPLQDARAVRDLYRAAKVPLPNGVANTLTVPSGFGPAIFSNQRGGVALGVGVGGVSRVPYTDKPDGGIGFGLSFGNAFETVGVALGVSLNDLSDLSSTDRISGSFQLSRYLSDGLSVAVGGENLFVRTTDGEETFYLVGSWAFDAGGGLPFDGVATLGMGSGRFAAKTDRDAAEGKGEDGTVVFGAIAWELTDRVNLIADWNGRNMSIGGAFRIPKTGVSVRIGVRDITGYTGDGMRLTGSAGLTLARF